jgi:hypothetical protein
MLKFCTKTCLKCGDSGKKPGTEVVEVSIVPVSAIAGEERRVKKCVDQHNK